MHNRQPAVRQYHHWWVSGSGEDKRIIVWENIQVPLLLASFRSTTIRPFAENSSVNQYRGYELRWMIELVWQAHLTPRVYFCWLSLFFIHALCVCALLPINADSCFMTAAHSKFECLKLFSFIQKINRKKDVVVCQLKSSSSQKTRTTVTDGDNKWSGLVAKRASFAMSQTLSSTYHTICTNTLIWPKL